MLKKLQFENLGLFKDYFEIDIGDEENMQRRLQEQSAATSKIQENNPGQAPTSKRKKKGKRGKEENKTLVDKGCASPLASKEGLNEGLGSIRMTNRGGFVILIGENGSGKSCIFEIIRRCLSSEISKSLSRVPDSERNAYALCRFVFGENAFQEREVLEQLREESGTFSDRILSLVDSSFFIANAGIIYERGSDGDRYRILAFSKNTNKPTIMLLEDLKNKTVYVLHDEEISRVLRFIERPSQKTATELIPILKHFTRGKSFIEPSSTIMTFYHFLFGREGFVKFVFAHRGIGPMESTMSPNIERDRLNYVDSTARAELLLKLLPKEGTPEFQDYLETSHQLLGHKRYRFRLKEASGSSPPEFVFKETSDETGNEFELDLLKIPEGVYETHLFSLMLTKRRMGQTLCFDEPNRCLHPSVVENMREYILRTTKSNPVTILLSTHAPSFISKDTWRHMYRFSLCNDGSTSCKKLGDLPDKIVNRISSPYFREILLSNTILFVEGFRDFVLFQTLLTEIVCHRERVCKVFEQFSTEGLIGISKITVFETGGVNNWHELGVFCEEAKIPFGILFDQDKQEAGLHHITTPQNELQWKFRLAILKFSFMANWQSGNKFMKMVKAASKRIMECSIESSKDEFKNLIEEMLVIDGSAVKQETKAAFADFCHQGRSLCNQLDDSGDLLSECTCLFAWENDIEDFLAKVMPDKAVQKNSEGDQVRTSFEQRIHIFEQLLQSEGEVKEKFRDFIIFLLRLSGVKA